MISRHWPLVLAIALFVGMEALLLAQVQQRCGMLVFPLDDSYIHMAISKNLALHGNVGATRHEFGFSSSSPLHALMLATIFRVIGFHIWVPLVLNGIMAIALLVVVHWIGLRERMGRLIETVLLTAIVAALPMAPLALSGMEHITQTLLDLLLIYLACVASTREKTATRRGIILLCMLSACVTTIRYEGVFVVMAVCALLTIRRRGGVAALIAFAGFASIAAVGMYSVRHGGMFFPNPVLIKKAANDWHSPMGVLFALGGRAIRKTVSVRALFALLCMAAGLLICRGGPDAKTRPSRSMLGVLLAIAALHLQLASTGWFFRYEAYLIGILAVAVVLEASQRVLPRAVAIAGGLVLAGVFLMRGYEAMRLAPAACANIRDQQLQMSRFVNRFYNDSTIVLNDIGAVSLASDAHIIDLAGLDTNEIARHRIAGTMSSQVLESIAQTRRAKLAIVYDEWLAQIGGPPAAWVRVGEWTIFGNVICAYPTVTLYAVDPAEASPLREHLNEFGPMLPGGVVQRLDH